MAKTGALPGVTRHLSAFKVNEDPPSYIVDSPGIMVPRIEDAEIEKGLKLVLVSAIKDQFVPEIVLADYLLYLLNILDR